MISSTSSSDSILRPDLPSEAGAASNRAMASRSDRISTNAAAHLQSMLAAQPEIRADLVARARALAADPSYPSLPVIQSIARQIIEAPDLGADES